MTLFNYTLSIALAFEKDSPESMKQKTNGLDRHVFTPFMISSLMVSAVIETLISLGGVLSMNLFGYPIAQTLALLSVVINEFEFTYNCKELKTFSFKKGLFKNNFMNISIAILFVIQIIVFFTPIGSLFGMVKISWWQFGAVVAINIVGFVLLELVKPVLNKVFADK